MQLRLRLLMATAVAMGGVANALAEGVGSLRTASAISSSSGKPLFVVYGTPTCPYCVALMERLKTDQSLAKFANHYVPVKVESTDPDWPQFDRQYATDRNAVPRIYIVASDGTAIVKQVGAPQGDGLPNMLSSALEKSGPLLPPPRARAIEAAMKSVAELDAEADWAAVASYLMPIEGDVAMGNPAWEPIGQALLMLQTIDASMSKNLDAAKSELAQTTDSFEPLVTWAKVGQLQLMSVKRKREAVALVADLKRWGTDRQRTDSAMALAEAELLSYDSNPRSKKRAVDKLSLIARSSKVEPVSAMAKSLLSKIDPTIDVTTLAVQSDDYRTWTAKAGNVSKTAKLRQSNATHVQLEDSDGKLMTLRIDQLVEADQTYIRQHAEP